MARFKVQKDLRRRLDQLRTIRNVVEASETLSLDSEQDREILIRRLERALGL